MPKTRHLLVIELPSEEAVRELYESTIKPAVEEHDQRIYELEGPESPERGVRIYHAHRANR